MSNNNKIEETIKRVQLLGLDADVKMDDGNVRHFHHGHEYVEIGGMKWATMSIGANSVCDGGLYFAWGETRGYTVEQVKNNERRFDWTSYEYCNESGRLFTKYNDTDGKTVLDLEDDAANVHWGGNWRMPTANEFNLFGRAISVKWKTNYLGSLVNGLLCIDKNDSRKEVFFPAIGRYFWNANRNILCGIDLYSGYWSSSIYFSKTSHYFYFSNNDFFSDPTESRCSGLPIRGIIDNG